MKNEAYCEYLKNEKIYKRLVFQLMEKEEKEEEEEKDDEVK